LGFTYKGIKYRSKKHPLLEYIFNDKTQDGAINIGENHTFTLADISGHIKLVVFRSLLLYQIQF